MDELENRTVDDVRTEWEGVAQGWRRHGGAIDDRTLPVRERMRSLLAARSGDTVLELAAGLGALSRELAEDVAPDGRVVCSDLSEGMLSGARDHAPSPDLIEFRVLDAQDIAMEDDAVDGVAIKFGLMLLPDPARAAAECRRVLRPGGRLVAATWGPPEDNLWIATFGAAMLAHGHALPGDPREPGGVFSLATPDRLEALLSAAGFGEVEVDSVDVDEDHVSFDDYWQRRVDTSGPLTAILHRLDDDEVAAIRATCEEFASHLRHPDGTYTFPGRALVTLAR